MIEKIIPTIFATDVETLKKKFSSLSFSSLVHLDICDAKFVKTQTISLKDCFSLTNTNQKIEAHLMVKSPLFYLDDCVKLGVLRVFLQREIFFSIDDFIRVKHSFQNRGIEVALVLNPQTHVEDSLLFLSQVKRVMLMSVIPGAEGQIFIESVLNKVREIKIILPEMILQIDGGINLDTGKLALSKEIDSLCVGSFISSYPSPKRRFDQLKKL